MALPTTWRMAAAVLAAALLVSCASSAPSQRSMEYLDESTSATITRAEAPLVLYNEDPARAANARDYLYVAPLVVNQSGRRECWLWLGSWSTIDRGTSGSGDTQSPAIAAVTLLLDGEPMELDMGERPGRIPGVAELPYSTPVATATDILLPLTGSQLQRLSNARGILVYTRMVGGDAVLWRPWFRSAGATAFGDLAAAASPAP